MELVRYNHNVAVAGDYFVDGISQFTHATHQYEYLPP